MVLRRSEVKENHAPAVLTRLPELPRTDPMRPSLIICESYAGLHSQTLGLAEAAGLAPVLHTFERRPPWSWLPTRLWPAPLRAAGLSDPGDVVVLSAGSAGARAGAVLRRPGRPVVQVQNPRSDPARFDLVVVNRHDGLTGPNVIVTRTALHRVTPARLDAARAEWEPRLAHLPRPLVAVLIGGTNGRFRLDDAAAQTLAAQLASMMRLDRVGLALTPSRRTSAAAQQAFADALQPLGGWLWDGAGDNPYYGLLALAEAIVVTEDSVSMVSEACATRAPVLLASLPGRSRHIGLFNRLMIGDGRVRPFAGRLELWPAEPINDTQAAGDEVRRRLGL